LNLAALIFAVMFIVALGASLAMLFSPNAVHVALFLVVAQVALALAFLLQGAYFVAAMQIIVYAGAIMVLFLFVIMLLGVDKREALVEPLRGQRQVAIGLGLLLAAEISFTVLRGIHLAGFGSGGSARLNVINQSPGNVMAVARLLFSRYLLPFEATSLLLVVAIVGVMMLTRRIDTAASIFEPIGGEAEAPLESEREAV
jgi:NADH-quinone oxidoreductase subunit J